MFPCEFFFFLLIAGNVVHERLRALIGYQVLLLDPVDLFHVQTYISLGFGETLFDIVHRRPQLLEARLLLHQVNVDLVAAGGHHRKVFFHRHDATDELCILALHQIHLKRAELGFELVVLFGFFCLSLQ